MEVISTAFKALNDSAWVIPFPKKKAIRNEFKEGSSCWMNFDKQALHPKKKSSIDSSIGERMN